MVLQRSVSSLPGVRSSAGWASSLFLAAAACVACGGGEADGAPVYGQQTPFLNPTGAGGTSATSNVNGNSTGNVTPANGVGGTAGASEPNQGNGAPVVGASGSPSNGGAPGNNAGVGGSSMVGNAGGGTAGSATIPAQGGSGAGGGAQPPPLPQPPGDAFFFDDFEGNTVGQAPANWDYFVAWVPNQNNPSGGASALVDDSRVASGTRAVHFVGGQNPAQITLPLPPGTNRLFVRAQVFMTRQLGQNPGANHETLIGIRGTPGQASNEIRFGEIKGVIGTNEVPTDNISPKQDQWGMGPALAPNEWHCIEVQFIGDSAQNQLFAYADGELVHSVTAPDQWNNGNLGGAWMAGKFQEVILGWHSFSGVNTDVWMDDIVLSTGPIGCD